MTVNNKYPIDVKCIQSFNINQQLSEKAMDAFLELCVLRDAQLVTAYNEVNHDKAGFVPRLGCMYLLSTFAILLMQPDVSVEQFLNYDLVQGLIRKQTFQKSYRTVIPLFWKGDPNEWFLIIVDSSNHSVNFIFTKYSAVIEEFRSHTTTVFQKKQRREYILCTQLSAIILTLLYLPPLKRIG